MPMLFASGSPSDLTKLAADMNRSTAASEGLAGGFRILGTAGLRDGMQGVVVVVVVVHVVEEVVVVVAAAAAAKVQILTNTSSNRNNNSQSSKTTPEP